MNTPEMWPEAMVHLRRAQEFGPGRSTAELHGGVSFDGPWVRIYIEGRSEIVSVPADLVLRVVMARR